MVSAAPLLITLFKPLQLQKVLILHNSICCVLSICAVVSATIGILEVGDMFLLEHFKEGWLHRAMFIYWVSKFVELLDTVYMVLRHKKRQISFLHVFHHATVTLLGDYAYHYSTYPPIAGLLALNSAVHIVMYGYYALTAVYPLHDFSWKRRITQCQMIQFLIGIFLDSYGYLYRGFCIYSVLYPLLMLALFSNYYYHAFILKAHSRQRETKKVE